MTSGESGTPGNALRLYSKSARSPSPTARQRRSLRNTGWLTDEQHETFCFRLRGAEVLHAMDDWACEIAVEHGHDINEMEYESQGQNFGRLRHSLEYTDDTQIQSPEQDVFRAMSLR